MPVYYYYYYYLLSSVPAIFSFLKGYQYHPDVECLVLGLYPTLNYKIHHITKLSLILICISLNFRYSCFPLTIRIISLLVLLVRMN